VCAENQKAADYRLDGVDVHCRRLLHVPRFHRIQRISRIPRTLTRFRIGLTTYVELRRLSIPFDVVEFPDWNAEGWTLAAFRSLPLVVQMHGLPMICEYQGKAPSRDVAWASFLEHLAVRRADVIISPSSVQVQETRKIGWLRDRHIEIVPYAVGLSDWDDVVPVGNSQPVVLFIGRVEHWKAPETLARAMPIVRRQVPEAEAWFVGREMLRGGTPYITWMERTIGPLEGCKFLGYLGREQLKEVMSASRVLAAPSMFDSFSIVALEAMSAGRPVVATSAAGVAEFVESSGGGVIVPPDDPPALAAALLQFLTSPAHATEVGAAGRRGVAGWLTPDQVAARREALYQQAIRTFGDRGQREASGGAEAHD